MKITEIYEQYKRSNFMKKLRHSFVGMGLDRLFALLLPFVAVKLYGASVFGEFTYYFSIALIASVISQIGLPNGLIYFIPKTDNKYVSGSFLLSLIFSFITGVFIVFFVREFIIYIPILILISINKLFFGLHRSKQEIKSFYIMDVFLRQGLALICLFIFKMVDFEINILIAYFIGYFIASVAMYIYNRNNFDKIYLDMKLFKYSTPLMFTAIMASLMSNIDAIMIGNVMGTEEVGIYFIAAKIATLPVYMLTILNTVYAPQISKFFKEKRFEELKRSYIISTRILGVSSLVVIIFLVVFSKGILSFFGSNFIQAESVLLYRGIGQVVNSGVGSAWYMISMSGRSKLNMYGAAGATLLNVLLNSILIPKLGMEGAAIASMIAVAVSNIFAYILVTRLFKIKAYGIF